jgi:hypothetical protein
MRKRGRGWWAAVISTILTTVVVWFFVRRLAVSSETPKALLESLSPESSSILDAAPLSKTDMFDALDPSEGSRSVEVTSDCPAVAGCSSLRQCTDGCNTCECSHGNWTCSQRQCPNSFCPTTEPTEGAYCAPAGQLCGGWALCGPTCSCVENRWRCAVPDCALACPPRKPEPGFGAWCARPADETCSYGDPCDQEICHCVTVSRRGPIWSCFHRDCMDRALHQE